MKIFSFLILIAILISGFFLLPKNLAIIGILNNNVEAIKSVTINLCSETGTVENIEPHQSKIVKLEINGDCHYEFEVNFLSGKTLKNSFGYVTNGANFETKVIVTNSEISLGETSAK